MTTYFDVSCRPACLMHILIEDKFWRNNVVKIIEDIIEIFEDIFWRFNVVSQVADAPDPDIQPVRAICAKVWREHPSTSARSLRWQQRQDHRGRVQGEQRQSNTKTKQTQRQRQGRFTNAKPTQSGWLGKDEQRQEWITTNKHLNSLTATQAREKKIQRYQNTKMLKHNYIETQR